MKSVVQIAGLGAALALGLASPGRAAITEPIQVTGGQVSGTAAWGEGVRMFRGIPFAAPPVGPLRWKPPQPVAAWSGVKAADRFSPACMQERRPLLTAAWNTGVNGYSEDCLYLNVWTPANGASDKLPVMVWIYGGGGREGSGGEALYAPDKLAKRGVVVVSFNYRVNLFGWMAHPALTAESPNHASGDYGALDQIAALKWVKANIAAFGGDPERVTIFGESGGSRSVNWTLASPMSRGLVHGAIAESHTVFGRMQTLKEAEADGQAFGEKLGAKTLAQLRALPADKLMEAYLKDGRGMNAAIVDGWFLPADIRTIYETGRQTDVPLLTGGNADEPGGAQRPGGAPRTLADYTAFVTTAYGGKAPEVLKFYPASDDAGARRAYHDLMRDGNLTGHREWARLQAKTGKAPAFLYLFGYSTPAWGPDGKARRIGAPHGSEVAYVFDNLRYADRPWTAEDQAVADRMADAWVAFAKTGRPPGFPAYGAEGDAMMKLDATFQASPVANPAALDFLAQDQRGRR
jgi:para-nitrobenzyl esterase